MATGIGDGKPLAGAREPHTLTCPSPSRPPGGGSELPRAPRARARAHTRGSARARARDAGRLFELALRRFSRSPAHSKPGARSVAGAVAAAQLPWPPPPSGNPPPAPPSTPSWKGPPGFLRAPHFRPPLHVPSGPIGERLRVWQPMSAGGGASGIGRGGAGSGVGGGGCCWLIGRRGCGAPGFAAGGPASCLGRDCAPHCCAAGGRGQGKPCVDGKAGGAPLFPYDVDAGRAQLSRRRRVRNAP